jgi:hypothetical protein
MSHRKDFFIVEGTVHHFGNITEVGQYGDYFLPLLVKGDPDLISNLKEERSQILEHYGDNLEIATPPYLAVDGGVKLTLKWKPPLVEAGSVVLFGIDGEPLTATNQELQDATFKVSFNQIGWEYKGRCGTKLQPRKIQLVAYANFSDVFTPDVDEPAVAGDF